MRFRWGVLLALTLGAAFVAFRPLFRTFQLAATSDEYTQILLTFPISIALIWAERKRLPEQPRSSVAYGLVVLSVAALLGVLSMVWFSRNTADVQLSAQMLALVIWWIGSFVLCFGTRTSRLLVFPLGFLLWMVPLPAFALHGIIRCLQQGSAMSAKMLFAAAGVPLIQDGLQLSIPGLTIEIAKECSSIRSSLMLMVTTMVIAQVFLRSPLRKAFVIALAVPLSVAKNGLRIFTIAMLGTRVDPGFLQGRLHHSGGIVFFAIALVLVFALLLLLERGERRSPARPELKAVVLC